MHDLPPPQTLASGLCYSLPDPVLVIPRKLLEAYLNLICGQREQAPSYGGADGGSPLFSTTDPYADTWGNWWKLDLWPECSQ